MELNEDAKYRLAYLTLRVLFDDKLSRSDPGAHPGVLAYLDVLAGTQMASQAGGKRYASQREKLESFIDAEFGEEMLAVLNRAVAELV